MNATMNSLQERIRRLTNENMGLGEQVQSAQENLRLSANQNAKLAKELQGYQEAINNNSQ